jgi:hypothetical protein
VWIGPRALLLRPVLLRLGLLPRLRLGLLLRLGPELRALLASM